MMAARVCSVYVVEVVRFWLKQISQTWKRNYSKCASRISNSNTGVSLYDGHG